MAQKQRSFKAELVDLIRQGKIGEAQKRAAAEGLSTSDLINLASKKSKALSKTIAHNNRTMNGSIAKVRTHKRRLTTKELKSHRAYELLQTRQTHTDLEIREYKHPDGSVSHYDSGTGYEVKRVGADGKVTDQGSAKAIVNILAPQKTRRV